MPESIRINFVTGAPVRYVAHVEALATMPARLEAAVAGLPAGSMRTTAADGGLPVAQTIGMMIEHAQQTHENLYRMAWMTDPIVEGARPRHLERAQLVGGPRRIEVAHVVLRGDR